MRSFRLVFNEQKQQFHHDNLKWEPNPYGWITIAECELDDKLRLFDQIIKKKISKKKLTTKFVNMYWASFDGAYQEYMFKENDKKNEWMINIILENININKVFGI
jgi:hypothetical protein